MRIFRNFPLFVAVSLATIWLVIGLTAFAQSEPEPVADSNVEGANAPAIVTAVTDTDVGVIPGRDGCSRGYSQIYIRMDDEDKNNKNSHSGWTGAVRQDRNTHWGFCRVPGDNFKPAFWPTNDGQRNYHYAVLRLGKSCPNGSLAVSRYFDNEDKNNKNTANGLLTPNRFQRNVQLELCLFVADQFTQYETMTSFPAMPFEYGVFAASDFVLARATGSIHTDDEDGKNHNGYGYGAGVDSNAQTIFHRIVSGTDNTDIRFAQVLESAKSDVCGSRPYCKEYPRLIDLEISLYRTPTTNERSIYEAIIGHFADGIYEMSEGVHKVRNVYFYQQGAQSGNADVIWVALEHPKATPSGYVSGGHVYFGDVFTGTNFLDSDRQDDAGYALAHEWGHYYYGVMDEYAGSEACDLSKEPHIGSPCVGDLAVRHSVMNNQWAAADGSSDWHWLNFSVESNNTHSNAQHRIYEASAWTTLARLPKRDPRDVEYRTIKFPGKNKFYRYPVSGSIRQVRQSFPELLNYSGAISPTLDLNDPYASEQTRSELSVHWIAPSPFASIIGSGVPPLNPNARSPFYVSSNVNQIQVTLHHTGTADNAVNLVVRAPNEQIAGQQNCTASGDKETECTLQIENPMSGRWNLEVAIDKPPLEVQYTIIDVINTSEKLPLQAAVTVSPDEQITYPEPAVVVATLAGELPIISATLTAFAIAPDGSRFDLTLRDDGVAPDSLGQDGVYAGFLSYLQDGEYWINVTFDNQAGTAHFTDKGLNAHSGIHTYPVGENFLRTTETVLIVEGIKTDDHGNTAAAATLLTTDDLDLPGRIDYAGDVDVFKFVAAANVPVAVRLTGFAFNMRPRLRLYDSDGTTLLKEVSYAPGNLTYPFVGFSPTAATPFYVEVVHLDASAASGLYYISAGALLESGGESSPQLAVTPTTLAFSAVLNSASPAPQTILISNVGAGTLTWTANEAIPWLNLTPPSGSAPATVEARVDLAGLAAGTYTGEISFIAGAQTIKVTVNLTVSSLPPVTPTKPITLEVDSGNKSMQLTWNVTNDPDVASYRIQRAVGPNGAFGLIAPNVTNTAYFDTDNNGSNNLAEGTSYCYKVEALRANGQVVLTSNVACALFGKLDLWIPDTIGKPGAVVIVPINIRNADGLRIGSSDIWMDFNPRVLESVAVSRTALTASYAWAHSVNAIDAATSRVRIAYIHSDLNNPPPELHGDGSLFWFTFRVKGLPGSTSPLNLKEFITAVGGSSIQNETLAEVNLTLTDGLFTVEGEATAKYILGDVDADTLVRARDAALALRLANGERTPTQLELLAGDVNGNGKIDTPDSSMILYFAAKNEWPQPPKLLVGAAAVAEPSQSTTVRLDNGQGKQGENVQITLSASGLSNVAGGHFVLVYDPRIVQAVTAVSKSGLAANFDSLEFAAGDGLLSISFSDDNAINGDGALATITLALASNAAVGVAPLTLAEAKLNDLMGRDFVTNFAGNTLTRQSAQITVQAGDPVNNNRNVYLPLVSR